jgi:hypothetical protein
MSDTVVYKGRRYAVWTFPLEAYYEDHPRPEFGIRHFGLVRGYRATWGIEGDTLYLTEIEVVRPDGTVAGLVELFPGQGEKVEASWFSGQIQLYRVIRQRKPPHRKRDRFLTFQCGKLVRSELGEPYMGP